MRQRSRIEKHSRIVTGLALANIGFQALHFSIPKSPVALGQLLAGSLTRKRLLANQIASCHRQTGIYASTMGIFYG